MNLSWGDESAIKLELHPYRFILQLIIFKIPVLTYIPIRYQQFSICLLLRQKLVNTKVISRGRGWRKTFTERSLGNFTALPTGLCEHATETKLPLLLLFFCVLKTASIPAKKKSSVNKPIKVWESCLKSYSPMHAECKRDQCPRILMSYGV